MIKMIKMRTTAVVSILNGAVAFRLLASGKVGMGWDDSGEGDFIISIASCPQADPCSRTWVTRYRLMADG